MAALASISLRLYVAGSPPSLCRRDSFSKNLPSPPPPHLQRTSGRVLRSSSRRRFPLISAVSLDSTPPTSDQVKSTKYYFLVANAKFMLDEEEHFQEQLFERLRNYAERNKELDFWLVIEPKFLDKFPNITKRLRRPAVALVSTDATWITFMKLRLDRVLGDCIEADSFSQVMASNPVDLHFQEPQNWVAPYPKYKSGWWEAFLPKEASKTAA